MQEKKQFSAGKHASINIVKQFGRKPYFLEFYQNTIVMISHEDSVFRSGDLINACYKSYSILIIVSLHYNRSVIK